MWLPGIELRTFERATSPAPLLSLELWDNHLITRCICTIIIHGRHCKVVEAQKCEPISMLSEGQREGLRLLKIVDNN